MNQEVIESFFLDNQNQFSSETIRSYKLALSQFFTTCSKSYDEVRAVDIRNWLATMGDKGLKPNSIRQKLAALKSFYQYCKEENIIMQDPIQRVKTPQKEDSLPYYLTQRQLALLQELTKENIRDRAIVESLYSTGVRISELLNILLDDIKWDSRQIWIRNGKGNKERFVLFSHECSVRLENYLDTKKNPSDYLFSNSRGQPISRDLVQTKFREYSEELGFKVTPHTLRHTFAAYLAEKGMNYSYIQDLLGHSNVNSTRVYTRLNNQARKKQYDRYQK